MKIAERLEQHTKRLPPLRVGDRVRLQNQIGPHSKKWDKTGFIVEVKQHDQYVVRVDGSRRVTLRNRKFLRHYIPVHQTPHFADKIPAPISPNARRLLDIPKDAPSQTPSSPSLQQTSSPNAQLPSPTPHTRQPSPPPVSPTR